MSLSPLLSAFDIYNEGFSIMQSDERNFVSNEVFYRFFDKG